LSTPHPEKKSVLKPPQDGGFPTQNFLKRGKKFCKGKLGFKKRVAKMVTKREKFKNSAPPFYGNMKGVF